MGTIHTENYSDALQLVFDMGRKESSDILTSVLHKAYSMTLRDKFASGRLEAAGSKATLLNNLCRRLNIAPDTAQNINDSIYKQRLVQLVEKKFITDDQIAELEKLRVLLCIKVDQAHDLRKVTCGRPYSQAIQTAFNAAPHSFGSNDREIINKKRLDMRIDEKMAKDILDSEARKVFMRFISASRAKSKRSDAARELINMIEFSNLVVLPLREDVLIDSYKKLINDEIKNTNLSEEEKHA